MKRLLYIDESEGDIIPFVMKMDGSDIFKTEYIRVTDEMTLEELLELIDDFHFDCLVIDYFLKQEARVSFQGDEVVAAYQNRHPRFPVLMLSNKDDGAIEDAQNIDVTIIRSKKEYTESPEIFISRLIKMIESYEDSQAKASRELVILKQKEAEGTLDAFEEEKLIELDSFLDESLDSSNRIPNAIRASSSTARLDDLIKKADIIIQKLNSNDG